VNMLVLLRAGANLFRLFEDSSRQSWHYIYASTSHSAAEIGRLAFFDMVFICVNHTRYPRNTKEYT
jgi:hypothetical protein